MIEHDLPKAPPSRFVQGVAGVRVKRPGDAEFVPLAERIEAQRKAADAEDKGSPAP